jgi:hypothetical protein
MGTPKRFSYYASSRWTLDTDGPDTLTVRSTVPSCGVSWHAAGA